MAGIARQGLIKTRLRFRLLSRLLSDDSLTKKAYLNAVAAGLDYGARLLVALVMTPWLVAGLGAYYYGAWQVLNRLIGYLAPTSGQPDQALKWTLANQQSSTDYAMKRRYVGSALAIWAITLPLMAAIGAVLAWFAPDWLKTPPAFSWTIRGVAGLLVMNLVMMNLSALPRSVLQGENLGYKRMGLSAALVFMAGGFTWLALYLHTGILGVAAAALAGTALSAVVFLFVTRTYTPWFGVARPSAQVVREFAGLSGWFMAWDATVKFMLATDVVVLGFLNSVESVTPYTLTKYAPDTVTGLVTIVVIAVIPGLGKIIGSGDLERSAHVRGEVMSLSWLILTVVGSSVLVWNRVFVELWVGANQYAGTVANLLIVMLAVQFVLIENDAFIINLTLRVQYKVVAGVLSSVLAFLAASLLVGYFNLGIVGLCSGLILGRSILSIGYPILVGRFLRLPLTRQLHGVLRPGLVTVLLFALASASSDAVISGLPLSGLRGWSVFVVGAGTTALVVFVVAFYTGLTARQRAQVLQRVRMVMPT